MRLRHNGFAPRRTLPRRLDPCQSSARAYIRANLLTDEDIELTPACRGANVQPMRIGRLISALVLAASLAVLPVTAAMAMTHTADAAMGMAMSGDDCPCCKPVAPDTCSLKCCQLSVLGVAVLTLARSVHERLADGEVDAFVACLVRPEPPPPRRDLG